MARKSEVGCWAVLLLLEVRPRCAEPLAPRGSLGAARVVSCTSGAVLICAHELLFMTGHLATGCRGGTSFMQNIEVLVLEVRQTLTLLGFADV